MRRTFVSRQILPALVGASSLLLTGCLGYPDADERFDDPIIYTRYDNTADFADYKTFSIDSEVTVFTEGDGEIETDTLEQQFADQLIEQTVENLESRGYERVEKTADPDLGITISLVKGKVTGYYTSYWGYYWGYWGYYYPYYYTYSYDTSTLLTDAVDLKNAPPPEPSPAMPKDPDPEHSLSVKWTGLVYGVSQESVAQNLDRALAGIDQSFKQSLYFRAAE